MITFEIKNHIEIDENYQGINLTEFSIRADNKSNNDLIVDSFIRSNNFAYDSLRNCVKKEPKKGYLGRAFNIDKVKIADFRKKSKEETIKFLLNFLNHPDWGEDRNSFAKLLEKYFDMLNKFVLNDFYIISKDWFDKADEKLLEPENWIYVYYFLIISVDRKSNLLTLTEWTYD